MCIDKWWLVMWVGIVWTVVVDAAASEGGGTSARLSPPMYQASARTGAFDQSLYEEALDDQLCEQQLDFLANDTLRVSFLDASARFPSGLLTGNVNDLGNYHQCLAISEDVDDMLVEGKYCTILVPYDQNPIIIPTLPENSTDESVEVTDELTRRGVYYEMRSEIMTLMGLNTEGNRKASNVPETRVAPLVVMAQAGTTLAFCIPKVCSTRQAIDFFQRYLVVLEFEYQEYYCRLPNDKPLAAADYAAIAIFGTLALLVIASTTYDLHHIFILKRDPNRANVLYRCFSVYTNMIRLLTFNKIPGALECMDGVRAISMLWVIVGHTFTVTNLAYVQNLNDVVNWLQDFWSLWITSAPITVDTFFLLSGILVIYTIISKTTRIRFIKTLHLYVANRMLRMFPVLAAVVLLQASLFNHLADGPYWQSVAVSVERCRTYWWSALLHVQNYVNPLEICLGHSWYISVDTQLYLVAPVVMVFLFGSQRVAAGALALATAVSVTVCATYAFAFNFPSAIVSFGRFDEFNNYMTKYYINTIARSPPFVIGMVYGYVLHVWRNERLRIPRAVVWCCWTLSFLMMALVFFSTYPAIQTDHDNQLLDNFLNAFIRSVWAVALGWLILACVHGYGGPIDWFLSLNLWKLPARLSYAMFLLHFPLQMVVNGTWTQTKYFTTGDAFYRYLSDVTMTVLAALALALTVDAPFSTLQKLLMNAGGGRRRPQPGPKNVTAPDDFVVKTELPNGKVRFSDAFTEKTTL